MEPLTILRYEDKGHHGPYHDPYLGRSWNDKYSCLADHPRGEDETWVRHGSHVNVDIALYGFVSQAQLDAWFYADDKAMLADHGYQVVTYRVQADYVDIGRYQARFDPAGIIG
jgi:hypothetical protein